MDGTAIVLTGGLFEKPHGKTAHGLVRGTERFRILAVIDEVSAGKDAGEVLDGIPRQIPIIESLDAFLAQQGKPDYCILGIAAAGGLIPPNLKPVIRQAIEAGIHIVSGLHEFVSEMPEMANLAALHGVSLIDVRKPRHRKELHFWTGDIQTVTCPIIPVMGVDCAVGKRTTARFLTQAAQKAGLNAQMIYTGQTGWLQGGQYGFILDSTVNDFVSGELEHAIVSCFRETGPDVIFVEGQAALRNPSGPCGAEFLVSGGADAVILQAIPSREDFKGWGHLGYTLPNLQNEMALIHMYGPEVMAVTVNTQGLTEEAARKFKAEQEALLGIPVILPLIEGVEALIPLIQAIKK